MKAGRGFTLIELLVVIVVMTTVTGSVLTVASTVHREERLSAAYAQDVHGLRRAVQALERDLRTAPGPKAFSWALRDGDLCRDGALLARNVARFDVEWEAERATVHLALGPRSDAPHRREAVLRLVVKRRGGEGR
jgi:prepilin-type N-terminal cleavage/methylation domain-containing protein